MTSFTLVVKHIKSHKYNRWLQTLIILLQHSQYKFTLQ